MNNKATENDSIYSFLRESHYGKNVTPLEVTTGLLHQYYRESAAAHDALEIIYVKKGYCDLVINGAEFHMKKGSIAYLRPFHVHSVTSKYEVGEIFYCKFPISMLIYFSINKDSLNEDYNIVESVSPCINLSDEESNKVSSLFEELVLENNKKEPGWDLVILSCLSGILAVYKRASLNHSKKNTAHSMSVGWQILQYISLNFNKNINSYTVANKFNISVSQVNSYLRVITGKNFSSNLMITRIRNSCAIMSFNIFPIATIAEKVGYPNSPSFCRDFKKITKLTPKEYTQKNQYDDPFDQNREQSFEILTYITENYSENITIQSLSKHLFISESTLNNTFQKNFGMTFQDVLTRMRMLVAAGLLLSTSIEISQISILVGFNNCRSFNRLFLDEYGCSPTEFRKSGINESRHLLG